MFFDKNISYSKLENKQNRFLFYTVLISIFAMFFVPQISEWIMKKVYAGTLTSASLTISDSRSSGTSVTYDMGFTTTVSTGIKRVVVQFCTTASSTCTTPTGIGTSAATRASDNISGTGRTDDFATNGTLTTTITTTATQSPTAVTISYTGVNNPSTTNTTFFARITTYSDTVPNTIDSATVAAATLTSTSVAVSASVDATFTFTVAPAAGTVNGSTVNISSGTGAAVIPFGTLASGSSAVLAHNLTVATNAVNGYTVTVKTTADPSLVSASNNIDKFTGTNATPATWSSPNGTSASVNTGFFGYTTEDTTLTGGSSRFSSNKWAGPTTSPLELMYSSSSVSGATETIKIGWMAEVNSLQPQGSYAGTVILVATPLY